MKKSPIAHSIKGSAGTFGLDEFTEPAGKLQSLANERNEQAMEAAISDIWELSENVDLDAEQVSSASG